MTAQRWEGNGIQVKGSRGNRQGWRVWETFKVMERVLKGREDRTKKIWGGGKIGVKRSYRNNRERFCHSSCHSLSSCASARTSAHGYTHPSAISSDVTECLRCGRGSDRPTCALSPLFFIGCRDVSNQQIPLTSESRDCFITLSYSINRRSSSTTAQEVVAWDED